MRHSKSRSVACAAFTLLLAGSSVDPARAGEPDRLLATLDARLPLEPRMPDHTVICSTVKAGLSSAAFASPSTTDPDIDSIAAVAANPTSRS